jgi:RNA polymerase sigma-70 factor (ECF subfamily)
VTHLKRGTVDVILFAFPHVLLCGKDVISKAQELRGVWLGTGARSAHNAPDSTTLPDAEVRAAIHRIAQGDAEAFEIIFARHRDEVFRTAWRMTSNFDDAMDVTQEVFVRVFYALRSWKGRVRFATWLNRIACNTAIDYLRRRRRNLRYTELVFESASDNEPDSRAQIEQLPTALSTAELNELRTILEAAISRLSGQQRKCFVLRHYQELSIKEIAATIGRSQGSVKRHLYRAVMRLRKILCTTLKE